MTDSLIGFPNKKNKTEKNINFDFLGYPDPSLGKYIGPPVAGFSTITVALNDIFLMPIFINQKQRFDRIACRSGPSATTGQGRLGVYSSSSDGKPRKVLYDAGLTSAFSTINSTYAISIDLTLNRGMYFLAFLLKNANTNINAMSSVTMTGYSKYPNTSTITSVSNAYVLQGVTDPNLPEFTKDTILGYRASALTMGLRIAPT